MLFFVFPFEIAPSLHLKYNLLVLKMLFPWVEARVKGAEGLSPENETEEQVFSFLFQGRRKRKKNKIFLSFRDDKMTAALGKQKLEFYLLTVAITFYFFPFR